MADDGLINSPAPTLSASGENATGLVTLSVTAPTISATGIGSSIGNTSTVVPTLEATGYAGRVGTASIIIPAPTLDANVDIITVPVTTVEAAGLAGAVGGSDIEVTAPDTDATLLTGMAGVADIEIPYPTVNGSTGPTGDITVAAPVIESEGCAGASGTGAIFADAASISATAYTTSTITGSNETPAPTVFAAGLGVSVITGDVDAAAAILEANGATGRVGTADIEVPVVTISADGYLNTVGTATVNVPMPTVSASGITTLAAPTITGVALNTRVGAVTEYTGLAVNSICNFNGYTLAALDTGIAVFTGSTDDDADIAWTVEGAEHDFKTSAVKKLLAGYVSCRITGDVLVTLSADDMEQREYVLAARSEYLHVAKVRFGMGVMGNRWQWGIKSTGGTADIGSILIDVEQVRRRIR